MLGKAAGKVTYDVISLIALIWYGRDIKIQKWNKHKFFWLLEMSFKNIADFPDL